MDATKSMLIINADDWGRSRAETDAAFDCYAAGRITSASAMVFMEDSERAAERAKPAGVDVGLHLNLSQKFTGKTGSKLLSEYHYRIVRFLTLSKYSLLLYNPMLRKQFRYVYQAQAEEFHRLYGKPPSHVDGHQHKHLCANMIFDEVIPRGQRVRRNFSFWPGEKGVVNRTYRRLVDQCLHRTYRIADHFFALSRCLDESRLRRVLDVAKGATVELMTHPAKEDEYAFLMSDAYRAAIKGVSTGAYLHV